MCGQCIHALAVKHLQRGFYCWVVQELNPDSKKVADMAVAAGEAWRKLDPVEKVYYERLSTQAKVLVLWSLSNGLQGAILSTFWLVEACPEATLQFERLEQELLCH